LTRATTAVPVGLRERNKAEKLRRIRQAARGLFLEKGYDDTTIRELAERADVGFGTLFTYASDKRDLLFLIFNDELVEVVEEAFATAVKERILLHQLVLFFKSFYRFFAQQPALSRLMLRELAFYVDGKQARQFQQSRDDLLRRLGILIASAQESGRISSPEEPEELALAVFAIYASELRRWLRVDEPDLEDGLAHLEKMLRLQIVGFGPKVGAL
jgi:AcrR family transcriptional regulator